jgi:hypothetical protein
MAENRAERDRRLLKQLSQQTVKLQLFCYDIETRKETEQAGISIDEADWPLQSGTQQNLIRELASPANLDECAKQQQSGMIAGRTLKEISEIRPQFCVTFSHEFGSEQAVASNMWKRSLTKLKDGEQRQLSEEEAKERKFLDRIFFTVQQYMRKEPDGTAPPLMPFRMFRIQTQAQPHAKQIYESGKLREKLHDDNMRSKTIAGDDENFIDRQVQFCNHITNYYIRKEEQATTKKTTEVHFLITNMFCMNEITYNASKDEVTRVKKIKRGQLDNYQKIWNSDGIKPSKLVVNIAATDGDNDSIEQYFFVDSRNIIQLLFPTHDREEPGMPYSKVKSLKIKEEISKELYRGRSVESMDFKLYKKITCISTKPPSSIQQEYIRDESQLPEEIVEIPETPPEIYHQQKI